MSQGMKKSGHQKLQKNPEMALSLPLISEMVGISAMTHKYTLDLWVFIVHPQFGGLSFHGADIKEVQIHKREALS